MSGQPVEFFLTEGSLGDVEGLPLFDFDLPANSEILADKAYNHYEIEDVLAEVDVNFRPIRKKNSRRPYHPWKQYLVQHYRKIVETEGSMIERLLPKSIHAVTAEGLN